MEPPDTLQGQLRRGLARGFRRALHDPRAGGYVYRCVVDDPRYDRQVESRRRYLTRLGGALVREMGSAASSRASRWRNRAASAREALSVAAFWR